MEVCNECIFGFFRGAFLNVDGPCMRLDDDEAPENCPEVQHEGDEKEC